MAKFSICVTKASERGKQKVRRVYCQVVELPTEDAEVARKLFYPVFLHLQKLHKMLPHQAGLTILHHSSRYDSSLFPLWEAKQDMERNGIRVS